MANRSDQELAFEELRPCLIRPEVIGVLIFLEFRKDGPQEIKPLHIIDIEFNVLAVWRPITRRAARLWSMRLSARAISERPRQPNRFQLCAARKVVYTERLRNSALAPSEPFPTQPTLDGDGEGS